MKILLTGANGQVGFCLAQRLAQSGWQYAALTRQELDISHQAAVDAYINAFQPAVIINAAAYTAVDKAEADQENAFAINRDGPNYLAAVAARVNAAIFHISTDYVFSGENTQPYAETDATGPTGVYGESKLQGEKAVIAANSKHIILRTAWVFGEHGNNFVKTMIRLGKARDQLSVVSDQQGGPTYADDIARTLLQILNQYEQDPQDFPWGIYHYAGAPHTNWCDFARYIFAAAEKTQVLGKSTPAVNAITTADYPTPARRPANSRLNCQKIYDNFGILPSDWQLALQQIRAYAD